MVLNPEGETPEEEAVDLVEKVLDIPESEYKKGLTMLFLKKNAARLLDRRMSQIRKGCEGIIDSVNRIWLSSMNQRRYRLNQDRLEKIQAYARGYMQRLIILKAQRMRRVFWAATIWSFGVRRFKRDRLSAHTIQVTLREIAAMDKVRRLMKERDTEVAKRRLATYVKTVNAQQRFYEMVTLRTRVKTTLQVR